MPTKAKDTPDTPDTPDKDPGDGGTDTHSPDKDPAAKSEYGYPDEAEALETLELSDGALVWVEDGKTHREHPKDGTFTVDGDHLDTIRVLSDLRII